MFVLPDPIFHASTVMYTICDIDIKSPQGFVFHLILVHRNWVCIPSVSPKFVSRSPPEVVSRATRRGPQAASHARRADARPVCTLPHIRPFDRAGVPDSFICHGACVKLAKYYRAGATCSEIIPMNYCTRTVLTLLFGSVCVES